MKLFVKDCDGYHWVSFDRKRDKAFPSGNFVIDGITYYTNEVFKIVGDFRKNYVICKYCGELVRKDKWEEHCKKTEEKADCLKCENLRKNNTQVQKKRIVKQLEDGTIIETLTYSFVPGCNANRFGTIEEAKVLHRCYYYACRKSGARAFEETLLSKYPRFYSKMLTVNALGKRWKIKGRRKFKCGNLPLYAKADEYGVIVKFEIRNKRGSAEFKYSPIYDKFVDLFGDDFDRMWFITNAQFEEIKEEVKKLWK